MGPVPKDLGQHEDAEKSGFLIRAPESSPAARSLVHM